jgi:YhcH/YjgK/YiaL family protein
MLLDTLKNASRYYCLHPGFRAAFNFLLQNDLAGFAEGRYAIDSEKVFALVSRAQGKGVGAASLEVHRRYIDIQYCVSGNDRVGTRMLDECVLPSGEYDGEKDIAFYSDGPAAWITLVPGNFGVFYPDDAHAPLSGDDEVMKIVIKVRCEWNG